MGVDKSVQIMGVLKTTAYESHKYTTGFHNALLNFDESEPQKTQLTTFINILHTSPSVDFSDGSCGSGEKEIGELPTRFPTLKV